MEEAPISATARMIPYLMDRLPPARKKRYFDASGRRYLRQLVHGMLGDTAEEDFLESVLPLLRGRDVSPDRLRLGGEYYALRKRWFRRRILERVESGVKQVVSLGAGFDFEMNRLADSYPGRDWFVVDRPATLRSRRTTWTRGPEEPPNLHPIPVTLGEESPIQRLRPHESFDPDSPAAVVLEALLMYLDSTEVDVLLEQLLGLVEGEGALIGSVLSASRGGPLYGGNLNFAYWNCLFVEEPFRWTPRGDELRRRLREGGFAVDRLQSSPEWIRSVHPDPDPDLEPFADQEFAFVADTSSLLTL